MADAALTSGHNARHASPTPHWCASPPSRTYHRTTSEHDQPGHERSMKRIACPDRRRLMPRNEGTKRGLDGKEMCVNLIGVWDLWRLKSVSLWYVPSAFSQRENKDLSRAHSRSRTLECFRAAIFASRFCLCFVPVLHSPLVIYTRAYYTLGWSPASPFKKL
jgi:hypothetical protein